MAYLRVSDKTDEMNDLTSKLFDHRILTFDEIAAHVESFQTQRKKAIRILAGYESVRNFSYDIVAQFPRINSERQNAFGNYFLADHAKTKKWTKSHTQKDISAQILSDWEPRTRFVIEANSLSKNKADTQLEKILYARDEIVAHNMKLIYTIAQDAIRRFSRRTEISNNVVQQYISSGVLGMQRSIETYNPKFGAFVTYTSWWVRQYVIKDINKNSSIYLSNSSGQRLRRLKAISADFAQVNNRNPFANELAELSGLKESTVVKLLSAENVISLQDPVGDQGRTVADIVIDENASVLEQLSNNSIYDFLKEQLKLLDPRERDVLKYRYTEKMTLEEVAEKFDLTRERIRQIQAKAIRKLRVNPRFRQIREIA